MDSAPFSFTAHAADIYYLPERLESKLKAAEFALTCVKNNKSYIADTFGHHAASKVHVIYHGVDLDVFKPGIVPCKSIDVLSIGNLVEKKGHRYLIEACEILKRKGIPLKCVIIGEGPEKPRLERMIHELRLEQQVQIEPRRAQTELPTTYAQSRIMVLPTVITAKGDRDGIPNVLLEAMAMGVPVISSDIPNLAELIENGWDGVLVPPGAAQSIAEAIQALLMDTNRSERIAARAMEKIRTNFDSKRNIQYVADMFSRSHGTCSI